MRAEAQIPHADEALRVLFQRFKEAPGSSAFEELAEALLARGHANEALQIAEHGLQINPDHASGRVQRAAALLALGRTRVAYVELARALAIEPTHHRGLRLLGRVFVEAGIPERAAALLQRRLAASAQPSRSVDARALADVEAEQRTRSDLVLPRNDTAPAQSLPPAKRAPKPDPATLDDSTHEDADIPELFASLTKDLGLGGADQSLSSRVEVTQVMRLRRPSREGHEDELSSIEGPIVDTTQPGQLEVGEQNVPPPASFLFDVITAPQLTGFPPPAPEDEPLFNEAAPFAVRPVQKDEASLDESDTVHDEEPTPIDIDLLKSAIADEAQRVDRTAPGGPPKAAAPSEKTAPDNENDRSSLPPSDANYLRRFERGRTAREIQAAAAKSSDDLQPPPKLRVIERRIETKSVILAIAGAIALIGYLVALGWVARAGLSVWMERDPPAVSSSP